jgi:hypothetical protein
MNLIIAGGRDFNNYETMCRELEEYENQDVTIISGCVRGADRLGERWAQDHGKAIREFPANWRKHGKAAGPIRNAEMADNADRGVVFWDGKSRGTKNMIDNANRAGLQIKIVRY